jgi:hypothetical protein
VGHDLQDFALSMERTTSFSVRNFQRTVSMGRIDQTHRLAAKSKARKCIINSPSGSSTSGLTTNVSRGPARKIRSSVAKCWLSSAALR